MEHAQPTWGWQIISGRNIWLAHGPPSDKDREDECCGNGAVLNHSKYAVKFTARSLIPMLLPKGLSVVVMVLEKFV